MTIFWLVEMWITSPGLIISLKRHISVIRSVWSWEILLILRREITSICRHARPLLLSKVLYRS